MLVADVGRGLLIATIPRRLRVRPSHLGAALRRRASAPGVSARVLLRRVRRRSSRRSSRARTTSPPTRCSNGSRAFSFLAGTSIGGVLVQVLRGPYALAIDAVSFIWSALFLGRIDASTRRRRTSEARRPRRRTLDPRQRDHPRRAARRRDDQLLQLHLLRAVPALRDASRSHVQPGRARHRARRGVGRTLLGSVITARISRRFGVGPTFLLGCFLFPAPLILVPAASGPHWLVLVLPVRLRVRLRARRDAARHHGGCDQRGACPADAPLARLGRVHDGQLRRASTRDDDRRRARHRRSACGRPCGSRRSARSPACSSCCRRRSARCARSPRRLPE